MGRRDVVPDDLDVNDLDISLRELVKKNYRHLKLETFIFLLRQHDIGWLCSSSDVAT